MTLAEVIAELIAEWRDNGPWQASAADVDLLIAHIEDLGLRLAECEADRTILAARHDPTR